ncbi:probable E3 ubiquitin-protein ligase XERICO [Macadamia integrifolia]|uniref:probable E3 ubiquitin-protein ligase XERICO n=1 Tax=Macadamia integrifolia TaxID=60698 RepID=UPI001C4E766D|nr:probable E3 ubiquitin-protein ligase XERICO [Macadamia integrifolia]
MGLPNFPSAADGVLPVLVMNTVLSVALLKNVLSWVLHVTGATQSRPPLEEDETNGGHSQISEKESERRISITLFKSLCDNRFHATGSNSGESNRRGGGRVGCSSTECCVCLYGFEENEEVCELSCKHFFHKGCLETWFDHKHRTCPLCRSTM